MAIKWILKLCKYLLKIAAKLQNYAENKIAFIEETL